MRVDQGPSRCPSARIGGVRAWGWAVFLLLLYAPAHAADVDCTGSQAVLVPGAAAIPDCEALLTLKGDLDPNGTLNWSLTTGMRFWDGVTLTSSRVTRVYLPSKSLSGTLPSGFTALSKLTRLSLEDNGLSGGIDSGFGDMPNLVIFNVHQNKLTGSIPESLATIANRANGDVRYYRNDLSGCVPPALAAVHGLAHAYMNGSVYLPLCGLTLSLGATEVGEGDGATDVTVDVGWEYNRTFASSTGIDVAVEPWAAGAADYTVDDSGLPTAIAASASGANGSFTITPTDDSLGEGREGVLVRATFSRLQQDWDYSVTRRLFITDNEDVGIVLDPTTLALAEGGVQATYGVQLLSKPEAGTSVTVNMTLNGAAKQAITVSPTSLELTPSNWNTGKTVTVTSKADVTGDQAVKVGHETHGHSGYYKLKTPSMDVTVYDSGSSPTVSLEADPASIGEDGGVSTIRAKLSEATEADVTVEVTATAVSPATASDFTQTGSTLTIAAGDLASGSASTVTITAVDNSVVAANKQVRISGAATGDRPFDAPSDVTVTIVEDENRSPEFADTSTLELDVAENTTGEVAGALVAASDPDEDTLGYTLSGPDAGTFSIDSSGQISVASDGSLDFETKVDLAFDVVASDPSGATATRSVEITLTDVLEPPGQPDPPAVAALSSTSLRVSWSEPANTGPDITDYNVQYRKSGSATWTDPNFEGTGTTTDLSGLDRGASYEVRVQAVSDEGTGGWSDSVTGSTNANQPPAIGGDDPRQLSVAENTASGTDIQDGAFTATDAEGDTVSWSVTGTDASLFAIDAGGQLSVEAVLNHEEDDERTFSVAADDGNGGQATVTVNVEVTDVEERPGKSGDLAVSSLTATSLSVVWSEPANTGPPITGYNVRYRKTGDAGWTDSDFTGTDSRTDLTGLDRNTSYEVQVQAVSDEGAGEWSDNGTGATSPNRPPVIGGDDPLQLSVAENAPRGTAIANGVFTATDPDDDPVTWTLVGTDAPLFAIDADGQVSVAAVLNHEQSAARTFSVAADDGAGGQARVTVNVEVSDVAEPPGRPRAPAVSTVSASSLRATWSVPANTGPPITDYELRYRRSGVAEWTDRGSVGPEVDATLSGLAPETAYEIQVRATNAEGAGGWSDSGAGTTAGNPPPTIGPTVTIAISSSAQAIEGDEGRTTVDFDVALSAPGATVITVDYETEDGTARAGIDYVSTAGTLSFAPGVRSRTIRVAVNGDEEAEPDETFFVRLSDPANAVLAADLGTGTILDDDEADVDGDDESDDDGDNDNDNDSNDDDDNNDDNNNDDDDNNSDDDDDGGDNDNDGDDDGDDETGDDPATIRLSETTVRLSESGARRKATWEVTLDARPAAQTTVAVRSSDVTVATVSPSKLTFEPADWDWPRRVEATAVDDAIDNPSDRAAKIEHVVDGDAGSAAIVSVTVEDDDVSGIVLSETEISMSEGGAAAYAVALATEPTGVVKVELSISDEAASLSRRSLTFNPLNWSRAQEIEVTAVDDAIDNPSNRTARIGHAVTGYGKMVDGGMVTVLIEDDDVAGVVLSESAVTVAESGPDSTAAWTAALTSEPTGTVTVTAQSDNAGIAAVRPSSLTFTPANWRTARSFTVTGVDDDEVNRTPRRAFVAHRASGGGYDEVEVDPVAVTVEDDTADLARERSAAVTVSLAGLARTLASDAVDVITDRFDQGSFPGFARPEIGTVDSGADAAAGRRIPGSDGKDGAGLERPGAQARHPDDVPRSSSREERLRVLVAELARRVNGQSGGEGAGPRSSERQDRLGPLVAELVRRVNGQSGGDGVGPGTDAREVRSPALETGFDRPGVGDRVGGEGGAAGSAGSRPRAPGSEIGPDPRGLDWRFFGEGGNRRYGDAEDRLRMRLGALARRGFDWRFGGEGAGPRGGVWGRMTSSGFAAQASERRVDGDVVTGYLGVDVAVRENLLLGVAASHSLSDMSVSGALGGELETALTSLHPYGRWRFERGDLWGLAGAGRGDAELLDVAGSERTDLSLRMAALGGSRVLCLSCPGGFDLRLKSDAFVASIEADEQTALAASRATAERVRLMLEGRWALLQTDFSSLSVSGEFGGRWDGGDAVGGMGAEIGGELTYRHLPTGLTLEASGRYTPLHQARVFEDWGLGLSLGLAPRDGGQGARFHFGPTWGASRSNVDGLWNGMSGLYGMPPTGGAPSPWGPRRPLGWRPDSYELEFGYGLFAGNVLVDVFASVSERDFDSRDYRMGASLTLSERLALRFSAEFARREGLREDQALLFSVRQGR